MNYHLDTSSREPSGQDPLGIPKGDACNKQERADQGREGTPAAKPDCPEGHEAEGATGQCREAGQA